MCRLMTCVASFSLHSDLHSSVHFSLSQEQAGSNSDGETEGLGPREWRCCLSLLPRTGVFSSFWSLDFLWYSILLLYILADVLPFCNTLSGVSTTWWGRDKPTKDETTQRQGDRTVSNGCPFLVSSCCDVVVF